MINYKKVHVKCQTTVMLFVGAYARVSRHKYHSPPDWARGAGALVVWAGLLGRRSRGGWVNEMNGLTLL